MMQSLYIRQFKNVRELTIDKLKRVNLIVGKNNVGKSTILEAIAIFISNGSENVLRQILKNRGEEIYRYVPLDHEDYENLVKEHYLSLFRGRIENYDVNYSVIIGDGNDEKNSVVINQVNIGEREEEHSDGSRGRIVEVIPADIVSLKISDYINVRQGLMIKSVEGKTLIPYARRTPFPIMYKSSFQFVRTSDFNSDDNSALYDKIALSPEEDYIIQALNVIEPSILKISFINNENSNNSRMRIPIVSVKGIDKRLRLSSMGDGINRILTIILALLNCKDGVLLLDEFETGLHYSIQEKLWHIIFMLSEKLNIQVFATTHSDDSIHSFVKSNASFNGYGQIIRLENRHGDICANSFDNMDDLKFVADNSIEIR